MGHFNPIFGSKQPKQIYRNLNWINFLAKVKYVGFSERSLLWAKELFYLKYLVQSSATTRYLLDNFFELFKSWLGIKTQQAEKIWNFKVYLCFLSIILVPQGQFGPLMYRLPRDYLISLKKLNWYNDFKNIIADWLESEQS